MFTGIVEIIGEIVAIGNIDGGLLFTIRAPGINNDLNLGDSISINGVCLTVVATGEQTFSVEAVGETLEKTNLLHLKTGDSVNLEQAMPADGRFGGHIVQGHVNATGEITEWRPRGENWYLEIAIPEHLKKYIILEGSIAIDGISLTVAKLHENFIGINIIPHTSKATNLQMKKKGDLVNIEVDVIAKYIENILLHHLK